MPIPDDQPTGTSRRIQKRDAYTSQLPDREPAGRAAQARWRTAGWRVGHARECQRTRHRVPGHTPGSMGFIIPVFDRGERHVAALFGGSWLTPGLLNDEAMQTYIASVAHFRQATVDAGVDAWLQNHPLMVPFQGWLTRLSSRGPNDMNPFVVGRSEYQNFLDVIDGCSRIALARRGL